MAEEIANIPGTAPLVSVVVLTWNRRALLAETVESILAQTMRDLELLIVDNESTDDTQQWASAHPDARVRYLRHANHGIISANRNYGIEQARGRWVAFCDDDDLWLPDKLERQVAAAQADPQCGLVSTDALRFTEHGDYGRMKPGIDGRIDFAKFLEGLNPIVLTSVMVRRDVFDSVGRFNEDPRIFTIEDYEMWIRVAASYPVRVVGEPLVRYRVHAGAASHRDQRQVIAKERVMFADLRAAGVIDDVQFATAMGNLARRDRRAAFTEALKRVPGLTGAYYRVRALWVRLGAK